MSESQRLVNPILKAYDMVFPSTFIQIISIRKRSTWIYLDSLSSSTSITQTQYFHFICILLINRDSTNKLPLQNFKMKDQMSSESPSTFQSGCAVFDVSIGSLVFYSLEVNLLGRMNRYQAMLPSTCKIIRGGDMFSIDYSELVRGDIVLLSVTSHPLGLLYTGNDCSCRSAHPGGQINGDSMQLATIAIPRSTAPISLMRLEPPNAPSTSIRSLSFSSLVTNVTSKPTTLIPSSIDPTSSSWAQRSSLAKERRSSSEQEMKPSGAAPAPSNARNSSSNTLLAPSLSYYDLPAFIYLPFHCK